LGGGHDFDLYTYGVYMTMVVVISHHLQVAINTRNFGLYLVGWAIFSISMLPVSLWVANLPKDSKTYRSTYTIILKNPLIWLMVFVACALVVLPIYVNKRWV